MNSNPRNSLDYQGAQLEQLSDVSLLEVMELLSGFLDGLSESSFSSVVVYLIDKGTKLLDETNPLHDSMLRLIEKSEMVIAAADSISFYEVTYDSNSKIVEQSSRSIAEDIIYLPGLFVLE